MSVTSERIGSYVVVEEIGHGTLATVFLARDQRSQALVALKPLPPPPPDVVLPRRIVAALGPVAALDHPNVVRLVDCFEHGGAAYVAMEHLRGGSLRPLARTLTPARAVDVLEQVLAGLEHAHAHEVVHGDVKPENVLLGADGDVKV